jgi:hypothetical protein
MEDVAVLDISYSELTPGSPATATVTMANLGLSQQETSLNFSISGSLQLNSATRTVTLDPPAEEGEIQIWQETYSFTVPAIESGYFTMTARLNGEHAFEEVDFTNNELTVTALLGSYGDLPYWVYSRDIEFELPTATAILYKPRGSWVGSASGTLQVHNNSQDIYRADEFKADGSTGNPVNISTSGYSGYITYIALINATLHREDFGENPLNGDYAYNVASPLLRAGAIGTSSPPGNPATQKYEYSVSCSRHGSHTYTGTGLGTFGDAGYTKDYHAYVYNGIPPEEFGFQRQFEKYADKSTEKYKFGLAWEGTHYPMGVSSPAKVIRWMCHLDKDGAEEWRYPVPGQYERTFIGQSSGTVTWEIEEGMEKFYAGDRKAASLRRTGKYEYEHAVFATDKLLQSDDWPIKSGYYFNPGGTYKCTVHTEQYKDKPDNTQEHQELVEAVKNAFIYESGLVYADARGNQVKLTIALADRARGLLEVTGDGNAGVVNGTDHEPLATSLERDEADDTDPLIKEVLEGYEESGTADIYTEYQYREQTDKKIWLVKETTEIVFTVTAPAGKKLYTHVNMKNGEYAVAVKVKDIKFTFENNGELKMDAFTLDGIKVTVSGSMYDDRN